MEFKILGYTKILLEAEFLQKLVPPTKHNGGIFFPKLNRYSYSSIDLSVIRLSMAVDDINVSSLVQIDPFYFFNTIRDNDIFHQIQIIYDDGKAINEQSLNSLRLYNFKDGTLIPLINEVKKIAPLSFLKV